MKIYSIYINFYLFLASKNQFFNFFNLLLERIVFQEDLVPNFTDISNWNTDG